MDPTTTTSDDRSEFCLFDLETTVPGRQILEFGAILVCLKRLVELDSYSSLVRPDDLSSLPPYFDRGNGISRDAVAVAPPFSEIADKVHDFLHGRVWVGHNIEKFDCLIIREAFEKIGRPAPEPKEIIDTLALLTQSFGSRAGDMTTIYGRSLPKSGKSARNPSHYYPNCPKKRNIQSSGLKIYKRIQSAQSVPQIFAHFCVCQMNYVYSRGGMEILLQYLLVVWSLDDVRMNLEVIKHCAAVLLLESSLQDGYAGFLELDEVSVASISASLHKDGHHDTYRIKLLHKDVALQLFCPHLRVLFEPCPKYFNQTGRLNFVVDAPPSLCGVLETCDDAAKEIFEYTGSKSEWRPVVNKDYHNPTVRLRIPTSVNGDQCETEIHRKDCSGAAQKLVFSKIDAEELGNLLRTGIFVDAFFSLDTYDYRKSAGIRLVAKKLVIHSD
ncbi:hypothetical protein DITRI_Ditri03aG0107800 [Diplodiscus trichospermus]